MCRTDLPIRRPTHLHRHFQSAADLTSCVPPSLSYTGTGIFNPFPIDYAFRPRLRGRLTLRGRTFRRKPWDFGGWDSHPSYRYSCLHNHLCTVQVGFHLPFNPVHNAPLLLRNTSKPAASADSLSPDHFRRQTTRPVSYYALFKWWLLLSQHPGCLRNLTSFST